MASLSPPVAYTHHRHRHHLHRHHNPFHFSASSLSLPPHFFCTVSYRSPTSQIHLHRSLSGLPLNPSRSIRRCPAGSSGPPPDEPDPPPGNPHVGFAGVTVTSESISETGVTATLSRLRDSVQIFLAVLFWMSLFFWSSAWDGKNNGRRNKGNHFKR